MAPSQARRHVATTAASITKDRPVIPVLVSTCNPGMVAIRAQVPRADPRPKAMAPAHPLQTAALKAITTRVRDPVPVVITRVHPRKAHHLPEVLAARMAGESEPVSRRIHGGRGNPAVFLCA